MFSDKATKAIQRYQSDTTGEEIRGLAEIPGPYAIQGIDYSGIRNRDTEQLFATGNRERKQISAEPAEILIPADYIQARSPGAREPSNRNSRSPFLHWLLVAIVPIALGWAAFIPVEKKVVLPAVVIDAGKLKTLIAETGGISQETFVREGDYVNRGQLLLRMTKPSSEPTRPYHNELVSLSMQEARLKAQLAQSDFITYPTDLETEYRNPAWARSLTQQQQILSMNMREDAELLAPLRRLSNRAESELMDAKATKQAIRKQLATARTRFNHIKALKDRGVVYEEGVYTEPLYITLQATIEELKRELKNQSEAVKTAQQRLVDVRGKLEEKQLQRGQGLRADLRETQRSIMRIKTRLEALTLKQDTFDLRAPEDGIVERLHAFAPGESISPYSTLMALRTQGSKGLLEVSLPSTEIQQIDSGQQVTAVFSQPGNSIRSVYIGRVKSHTYTNLQGLEDDPQKLWVEIDIPASREHATRPLAIGMLGEISIEFEDEPLWRSLADGYVRLSQ